MTTWADFLAEVRLDVQDTGATPRWTDEMLWIYTKDAIRDYSQWFPKRVDRLLIAPVNGVYALPADYVDDVYVECPEDRILERRQEIPGRRYGSITRPLYYHIQGGNLYLNGSPLDGDNLYLTYDAVHPVPASETDTTFVLTVPDADIELIRLYVRAQVHAQMRSKQARLDRFEPGSGRRDDNPLTPEMTNLMADYNSKIALRIKGRAIKLYRVGYAR
jgi:hypothetical protein